MNERPVHPCVLEDKDRNSESEELPGGELEGADQHQAANRSKAGKKSELRLFLWLGVSFDRIHTALRSAFSRPYATHTLQKEVARTALVSVRSIVVRMTGVKRGKPPYNSSAIHAEERCQDITLFSWCPWS